MAIYPISANRSTNLLAQTRLLAQVSSDQLDILRLQTQVSTGRRVLLPSDDPSASSRAMSVQRLLELKAQAKVNLTTSQSYLSATDTAVAGVSNIITQLRSTALGVSDSTSTPATRQAAITEIQQGIEQLLTAANQNFRGRYLFAGGKSDVPPFQTVGGDVAYLGNDAKLSSYADLDLLFATNLPGSDIFGGFSAEVQGNVDLNPALTPDTRLADLRAGQGVTRGSIAISDGISTRVVDIASAETIGDVADLIEANPPAGRQVRARVTSVGLEISFVDGNAANLTVREVGSGATAADLGIRQLTGIGDNTLVGADLNPRLQLTAKLADLFGARATAVLDGVGRDNGIVLEARVRGAAANGVTVQYVDDNLLHAAPGLAAGSETTSYSDTPVAARAALPLSGFGNNLVLTAGQAGKALNGVTINLVNAGAIGDAATVNYNAAAKTLTIGVDSTSATQVQTVINAINANGTFTAAYDASDATDGGLNPAAVVNVADVGVVQGRTGNSGADARTALVYIRPGATTANQVVAALQGNATINAAFEVKLDNRDAAVLGQSTGNGVVNVNAQGTTRLGSGADFDQTSGLQITNGGATQTVSFAGIDTLEGLLNQLNGSSAGVVAEVNAAGNGIQIRSRLSGSDFRIGENGGTTATQLGVRSLTTGTQLSELNFGRGVSQAAGTDFTIRRNDGLAIAIDIGSAKTLGEVVNLINNHPSNPAGSSQVVARLAEFGNGIELVDDSPQPGNSLRIDRTPGSEAAWDLGLIARGADQSSVATSATAASTKLSFPPPNQLNTGIQLTAGQAGTALNGVQVVLVNTLAGDAATATFDSNTKQLTIAIDATQTTANTVIAAIQADGTFGAALDTSADPTNNGSGVVGGAGTAAITTGGKAETLTGADVNPAEVKGVFNTLIRLKQAIEANDLTGIQRSVAALDVDLDRVNFGRAEIGARSRSLDTLADRIGDEQVQLKATLSTEIETDATSAISELLARKASLEASFQLTGQVFQLSLLNYL